MRGPGRESRPCLRWMRDAAQEECAGDTAGRANPTESRLAVLQLGRYGTITVDVFLDDRVPAGGQVVGQLVASAAVMKRQAAGQNHQVLVLILPQAVITLAISFRTPRVR